MGGVHRVKKKPNIRRGSIYRLPFTVYRVPCAVCRVPFAVCRVVGAPHRKTGICLGMPPDQSVIADLLTMGPRTYDWRAGLSAWR